MRLTLILICFMAAVKADCQYQDTISLKTFRDNETSLDLWSIGGQSSYFYKIGDNDLKPIGKRGKHIKPLLLSKPSSKAEWNKSRRSSTIGFISSVVGYAAFSLAINELTDNQFGNDNTLRNIGFGTSIVFIQTARIYRKKSRKQFKKAIKEYNGFEKLNDKQGN